MNYFVNGMSGRYDKSLPIDLTNFEDYTPCFGVVAEALKLKPGAWIALRIVVEEDSPAEDYSFDIRYRYEDGNLAFKITSEEGFPVNEYLDLYLTESGKVGSSIDPLAPDETVEDIVKIIKDYGFYAGIGVQWAAFLMKESQDGTIDQYFDELHTLEIH